MEGAACIEERSKMNYEGYDPACTHSLSNQALMSRKYAANTSYN